MIRPFFTPHGSLDHLSQLVGEVLKHHSPDGLLVFGCVANVLEDDAADSFFTQIDIPIGGGLFPSILFDMATHQQGWIVYATFGDVASTCTENISLNCNFRNEDSDTSNHETPDTRLVIVDGHSKSISSFLANVYATSSTQTRFFGGGAGSLTNTEKRCIISNRGLLRDAAVVFRTDCRSGIGVSHGWRTSSHIMRATATDGNVVRELDFRPAIEVYQETIKLLFGKTVDPSDMIATASMFPLGIRRIGGSVIVRDPIGVTEEGGLICVGEFDKDCFVYILTSELDALLDSTSAATLQSETELKSVVAQKVVFDCISRYLLMKENFSQEISKLSVSAAPVSGVLSIGEIAGNSDGFLEFYNKTTAVAAFAED